MQNGAAVVEISVRFLKKLNIELPRDPATPLLSTHLENQKRSLEELCVHNGLQQHNSQQPRRGSDTSER